MTVLTDAGTAGSVFALAAAVQVTVQAAATAIVKGDLIAFDATGWVKADATLLEPELIALESGAAGAIIKASRMAMVGERYTVATGTVAGVALYVSALAPGEVTETIPTTAGDFRGKVGKIMVAGTATVKPMVLLEVPVLMPVHRFFITVEILAASVDGHIFTAIRPCIVRGVSLICSVAGETSSTVDVKKIDAVEAPASGTTVLTGAMVLDGTANTVVNGTLAAVAACTLAAGDGLALDHTGTITSLVGRVTIELEFVE